MTVNPKARDEAVAADEFFASTGRVPRPAPRSTSTREGPGRNGRASYDLRFGLFESYVPESDATLIAKLKEAGAIVLAKTTMCDFAMGWFSSSSLTGHTKNPYDLHSRLGWI